MLSMNSYRAFSMQTKYLRKRRTLGAKEFVLASHAVAWFIAVTHQNPLLAAPLLALRGAILDLEKGITNPIITPGLDEGRRSRSSLKKHAITVAAICLETLVELGDPVDQAASRIARYAGEWRVMGDQPVTATTVKNWRHHQRALPAEQRKAFELMRNDLLTCGNTRGEIEALLHNGPRGIPKT